MTPAEYLSLKPAPIAHARVVEYSWGEYAARKNPTGFGRVGVLQLIKSLPKGKGLTAYAAAQLANVDITTAQRAFKQGAANGEIRVERGNRYKVTAFSV